MKNSPESLPSILQPTHNGESISVYCGNLDIKHTATETAKLKKAFPQIPPGFYDVLFERLKANGFSDQRLSDSINHMIDNFTYPVPTIANIIGFDKRVKLLTYSDMARMQSETGRAFIDNVKVRKNGKVFWISKAEKEQFNIPDEL